MVSLSICMYLFSQRCTGAVLLVRASEKLSPDRIVDAEGGA